MKPNTYFKNNKETAVETAKKLFQRASDQISIGSEDFTRALTSGAKYIVCNQFNQVEPSNEVGRHYKEVENPYLDPDIEVDFEAVEPETKPKGLRRKRIDHIFDIIDFEIEPDKLTKIIEVIDHDNEYGSKSTFDMYMKLK